MLRLLKNIIMLPCCSILLLIFIISQNLPAQNFHVPVDLTPEEWNPKRLENFVKGGMVNREDWANLPPDNQSNKGFYHTERKPVQFIGIHHDGSTDATLKSILKYHIKTNGWGDIAYHFVIDKKGQIYEGRSLDRASDTNDVFKSYGEERLAGIVNILLLGNYDIQKIQADSPQIRSAKLLVSYLYLKYPLVTFDSIKGHRDFIADSESGKELITCPGKNMYTPVDIIEEIKNFVLIVSTSNNGRID